MKTFKKNRYPLALTAVTLMLMFLIVPQGSLFGSNTDWFSQHVGIADHFRKTFYEQQTIFPDFSVLGAGSNFFNYAYYGYLRPDVLIACLLPMVSMKYIIITYAMAGVTASVLLCYHWLKIQGIEPFYCFIVSMLLACSNCFFHAHMQIMFVNYLPFLFLALISIDRLIQKGSMWGLILSLFFIYLHSFYFSISCLFVCFLYLLYKKPSRCQCIRFFLAAAISIAMAGILLLPTAFVILENKKDAGSTSLIEILGLNIPLKSLLYGRYGCGAALVTFYTLLLGIREKKTRTFSLVLFCCLFINLISYILNGTLYVRDKILIPFLPLILLQCCLILRDLSKGRIRHSLTIFVISLIPLLFSGNNLLIWLDAGILLLFILKNRKSPSPAWCLILCLVSPLLYVQTGRTDLFVPAKDKRQTIFTSEEISSLYQDKQARMDCLVEPLANVNYLSVPQAHKSSVYSSTTNTLYSHFFYDIMRNPIRINNRVALLPDANPFFESLMGIRYIQTHSAKVPYGYQVKKQTSDENGSYVLAENPNVQSMAYASFSLMAESNFNKLEFPYNLDAITNNTIIPRQTENHYSSFIHPISLSFKNSPEAQGILKQKSDDSYELDLKEETSFPVALTKPLKDQVLILTFDVESLDGKEVVISLNLVKNKLSKEHAPYPNENSTFTYILSSNEEIRELNCIFSPGHYRICNMKAYAMDSSKIGNPDTVPMDMAKISGKEVLKGSIKLNQDGYFVTSLPWQHGYTALVDGQETDIQIVNTAFVGFPLDAGKHEIAILFHAPFKKAGIWFTIIGFLLFFVVLWGEIKKTARGQMKCIMQGETADTVKKEVVH